MEQLYFGVVDLRDTIMRVRKGNLIPLEFVRAIASRSVEAAQVIAKKWLGISVCTRSCERVVIRLES